MGATGIVERSCASTPHFTCVMTEKQFKNASTAKNDIFSWSFAFIFSEVISTHAPPHVPGYVGNVQTSANAQICSLSFQIESIAPRRQHVYQAAQSWLDFLLYPVL